MVCDLVAASEGVRTRRHRPYPTDTTTPCFAIHGVDEQRGVTAFADLCKEVSKRTKETLGENMADCGTDNADLTSLPERMDYETKRSGIGAHECGTHGGDEPAGSKERERPGQMYEFLQERLCSSVIPKTCTDGLLPAGSGHSRWNRGQPRPTDTCTPPSRPPCDHCGNGHQPTRLTEESGRESRQHAGNDQKRRRTGNTPSGFTDVTDDEDSPADADGVGDVLKGCHDPRGTRRMETQTETPWNPVRDGTGSNATRVRGDCQLELFGTFTEVEGAGAGADSVHCDGEMGSEEDTTMDGGAWEWEKLIPDEIERRLRKTWEDHGEQIERWLQEPHMKGLVINPKLSTDRRNTVKACLWLHRGCFGVEGEVREVKGSSLSLKETTGPPRRVPLRRLSGPLREFVRKQIEKLLELGIIRPSKSPWAAAVCLTPKVKSDGTKTWRFAIDYRLLNKVTPMDSYVIPPVEDGLECLRGAEFISIVDMLSAYWSVRIEDDGSIEKTAFICHEGLFEWVRTPFGLKNSGAVYDRHIRTALAGLEYRSALVYRDDCCSFSKTWQGHLRDVGVLFSRFRATDMTVSASKCKFGFGEVEYLGYMVSGHGIRPTEKKTMAVSRWEWPTSRSEMNSFLGLTSHFRKFIKGYADMVRPLRELRNSKDTSAWPAEPDEAQRTAFNSVKGALVGPEVMLTHPDYDRKFVVETDASQHGLSGVLLQETDQGRKVVMYASRSLKDAETRYDRYERECLAVVWALDVFRSYLLGSRFTVITDNVGVKWALAQTTRQHRIVPWQMRLSEFDFDLRHRTRKQNTHCDALCNNPKAIPGEYGERDIKMGEIMAADVLDSFGIDDLRKAQGQDAMCKGIIEALQRDETDAKRDFFLDTSGVLCRQPNAKGDRRVTHSTRRIVPRELVKVVLARFHGQGPIRHQGRNRTAEMIGQRFWWKGWYREVRDMVKGCVKCRRRKDPRPTRQGLSRNTVVTAPMKVLAIDIVVNLPDCEGMRHILTVLDIFTRYAWAIPIPDRSAEAVARALHAGVLGEHGRPDIIRSDNEKAFTGRVMESLQRLWGIEHIPTRPYHSEANGHVERFHRFLNELLTIESHEAKWTERVRAVVFTYNCGVHASTGFSPYFLFHGREPKLPLTFGEIFHADEDPDHATFAVELTRTVRRAMRISWERQAKVLHSRQERENRNRKDIILRKDDLVMLWEPRLAGDAHVKEQMTDRFSGPHRVLRQASAGSYVLAHGDRNKEVTADIKDLVLYHPFVDLPAGKGQVRPRKIQPGDLCIVPLRSKKYQPFYVARVTKVNKNSLIFQWYGNLEDNTRLELAPEWLDARGDTYYSKTKERSNDRPSTNKTTKTKVRPEDITVYGFRLEGHMLGQDVLSVISKDDTIQWSIEGGDLR